LTKTNYRLKGNQKLYICPLSDLHIGSEQFNQDYFEYALDTIDNIQSDKRIYIVGDLIEHASKTVGNSSFHTTMDVNDQMDLAINYLKPFKKDIVFAARGNHELRSSKDYDIDIMRLIANALNCDYGYQNIDSFTINQNPFSVYVAHGKGSAAHFYTAESKIIRDTQHIQADMYLNGHNHRCGYFSVPYRNDEGIKRKHYAFTGAFLSYLSGYADMMQLPLLPEAFLNLSISKDLRVNPNLYYIDQRRPDLLSV
jgi:UDP-2,3-diacylglucosamine pyrophosphatase LpxH